MGKNCGPPDRRAGHASGLRAALFPMTNTKSGADQKRDILKRIEGCVCVDRQSTYGDAEDNFQAIADIWNTIFDSKLAIPFEARDVAAAMVAVKLARLRTSPDHEDNWIDMGGYATCGAAIVISKNSAPKKE